MKASETLTAMAERLSDEGNWCRGYWLGIRPKKRCLMDTLADLVPLTKRNAATYATVASALLTALRRRPGMALTTRLVDWNDRLAVDHRDVANLCHEAALIAKESEK